MIDVLNFYYLCVWDRSEVIGRLIRGSRQLSSSHFFKLASHKSCAMTNKEFLESISLDGEMWKDVVGYEGLYVVSNLGRIVSLSRLVDRKRYKFISKSKLLNSSLGKNGYLGVTLCGIDNNQRRKNIHRIVAEAFIPNPNNFIYIDHINTVRTDNKVENLRWCTPSMNNLNPITRSKQSKRKTGKYFGEIKPVVAVNILDTSKVIFYKSMAETRNDGFIESHVSSVCRGNRNQHKGYKWYFLPEYEKLYNAGILSRHCKEHLYKPNPLCKPIVGIKENETLIFQSIAESTESGFSKSAICRCCKGIKPQYKGYKWMYLSDYENLKSVSQRTLKEVGY